MTTAVSKPAGVVDRIRGTVAALMAGRRLFVCAALAFGLSGASLLGWAIGSPRLAGFGFAAYPNWPLAAVAYLLLPLAFLAEVVRARRVAWLLVAIPATIAILSLLEYCGLQLTGFDRLLFPNAVSTFALAAPGRPGLIPTASILMTSMSILLMERRGRSTAQALLLINAMTIGINLMSATLLMLGADVMRQHIRVAGSLPACFPPLFMAFATFEWMADQVRDRMLPSASREWRGGRFVLLFLIGLPAVLLPLLDHAEAAGWLSNISTEIIASAAYLFLILLILIWSLTRITHEHEALNALSRALDTVPIMMIDQSGRITQWSAGCVALFGWQAEEAVGQRIDFRLRIGPLDLAALRPVIQGEGVLRDIVVTASDGRTVAVRAQASRIRGGGDEGAQIAIALTDTTSLRRAQADLEASEAKLQIAIEGHQIGIFDFDIANNRVHWTLHAAIHHGAQPGKVLTYADWSSRIDPSDLAALEERREEAFAAKAPQYSFRYHVHTGTERNRIIEGSTRAFYDEDGAPVRLLGVTVDVTDREERSTALEHREAQLRSIIATIPDAMIITARDGTIRHASDTAARMFGCERADIVDHPLSAFILNRRPSDAWAEAPLQPVSDGFQQIGTPRNLVGRRTNGEEFPVELVVAKTTHETDAEFVAFVRDLTERQAEQARIDALSAEYAHFARMTAVGAMASTLAHELNQPLAACSNFLATARLLVKRGETDERVGDMLKQAGDQVLRAGEIIRRTREFVSKTDGDVSVETLKPLIQEAVTLGMTGNTDLNIRTRFSFEDGADEVVVDRIQIQQVIVNLVRNSAEALRGRRFGTREIHIATRALDGETVEVTVRDNGPGIPKSLLDTIGSPFQSTKAGGSMGLGLSICRRIVEAHGGAFNAHNDEAGGAVFSFTIPSWSEPQMAEALR